MLPAFRRAIRLAAFGGLALFAIGSAAQSAAAQHAQTPIIADLLDGRLSEHSLLDAALLASGTEHRSEFARHRFCIDRCVAVTREALQGDESQVEIAAAALQAIHHEILVGRFVDHCNNLATTLDRGDFNCVTASVVFQIVAERLGLNSHVELLPNHVRCQLATATQHFTVETTSATGIQPIDPHRHGRAITPAQLVGKLYYNRALDLLLERKFDQSLRHADLAWQLDPQHVAARENVAIVRSHWAVAEAQAGRFPAAISLLRGQPVSRTTTLDDSPSAATILSTAQVFVFRAWIEASHHVGSQRSTLRDQLLLSIAEHPYDHRLLQMLQLVPSA
jgi:hypothetical protein